VLRSGEPSIGKAEADRRAEAALAEVAIPDPKRALDSYAFQLSGGMNQRVMIAMALANRPQLLIADEPGTALDVTVQAQTLRLMHEMTERTGTSVLLISHNLGVVREFADRVYVIYRGRIVEHGTTAQLFHDPRHPYTRALLSAIPKISGGGLPDLPERSPDFENPLITHEGCGEPTEGLA
jgi:ABC-type dipeptide/oligopeptide/nickel transport system ATPase component